jgi:hypothetical protein
VYLCKGGLLVRVLGDHFFYSVTKPVSTLSISNTTNKSELPLWTIGWDSRHGRHWDTGIGSAEGNLGESRSVCHGRVEEKRVFGGKKRRLLVSQAVTCQGDLMAPARQALTEFITILHKSAVGRFATHHFG